MLKSDLIESGNSPDNTPFELWRVSIQEFELKYYTFCLYLGQNQRSLFPALIYKITDQAYEPFIMTEGDVNLGFFYRMGIKIESLLRTEQTHYPVISIENKYNN